MEFKEVKKKNGQSIIFCNFDELLKTALSIDNLDEELPKLKTANDEYIGHCPFCRDEGHRKHKLYIKSDLSVGHCFVCTRSFINVTDEVDTTFTIPNFFDNLYAPRKLDVVKLSNPLWSLDKYFNEFDDFSQVGYDYLINRHKFMENLYKILGFKFMDDNIVMPFKYKDEVFYYQIRFSGSSKIKYYFPPISAKPPYIIEHGENKKFIICEGVFDAISLLIQAPNHTPCAVLGSSISDYQIDFIREYVPTEILVYMDETKLSRAIATKLSSKIDYCPIRVIPSKGIDPEENLQKLIKTGRNLQWIK